MNPIVSLKRLMLLAALMFGSPTVIQADGVGQALHELERIMADTNRLRASYAAGKERMLYCGYCHGEDGNSRRDYIPNLAAQHPRYLFEQFEKFGDGRRNDLVMTELARSLSLQERIDLAVYFSQQVVAPRPAGDPVQTAAGERLYRRSCATCHGPEAQGVSNMPRLAGQPARYLETALRRFQQQNPAQNASVMIAISNALNDDDIRAVATFLQGR